MKTKVEILKNMMIRPPKYRSINNMPLKARLKHNQLTQPLEPLSYKLQEIPENQCPFTPLGGFENIPFRIARSHTGNLPVYAKYRMKRADKRTVIRHVNGDIDEFCKELRKIVSNQDIMPKVGTIEVRGVHVKSVKLWLQKLGF